MGSFILSAEDALYDFDFEAATQRIKVNGRPKIAPSHRDIVLPSAFNNPEPDHTSRTRPPQASREGRKNNDVFILPSLTWMLGPDTRLNVSGATAIAAPLASGPNLLNSRVLV